MSIDVKKAYQNWCQQVNMPVYLKRELASMKNDPTKMKDAFGARLNFGTAGMRGTMGAGLNRINIYTVRQATEGLANYMDTLPPKEKQRGVAISYDSRYHSREFAENTAMTLGAHDIPSYIFDDIHPVPECSFTVRHLHTFAGVMITASHNPKQYNGYKIYGPDGGQMPPKPSAMIVNRARKASDLFAIKTMPIPEMRQKHLMHIIGEDVDEAYLKAAKSVNINHDLLKKMGPKLKFVYTPLYGTGKVLARRALQEAGFTNYVIVPQQAIADPEFPDTPHPNPQYPQAFHLAIQLGKKVNADVLIATDPDADRLGAAVRQPNGEYALLTGNQIASILLNYILKAKKNAGTLPKNGRVVKSIVSTELATQIAKSYGVEMKNVLTGFKYIGQQIKEYEKTGKHTFLFGFEESYGYLIKPFVRDKDAVQSLMLLAEVAAYYKSKGMTMYDGLQAIYKKYGYFKEYSTSKLFSGITAHQDMHNVMKKLRHDHLTSFNGQKVEKEQDFLSSTTKAADGKTSKINLPKSNVMKYWLADGTWLTVRPSGTEPRVRFYIGTVAKTNDGVMKRLASYKDAVAKLIQTIA
ncbi:MAG: phospho-sugar mutase [Acetilactobacillus jinshanensis]